MPSAQQTCVVLVAELWGRWGSNPRPRDYEIFQGAFPTCTIISDLASDLRICCWRFMAVDGRKRPSCGHRVGTVWARLIHTRGRGICPGVSCGKARQRRTSMAHGAPSASCADDACRMKRRDRYPCPVYVSAAPTSCPHDAHKRAVSGRRQPSTANSKFAGQRPNANDHAGRKVARNTS